MCKLTLLNQIKHIFFFCGAHKRGRDQEETGEAIQWSTSILGPSNPMGPTKIFILELEKKKKKKKSAHTSNAVNGVKKVHTLL